MSALPPPPPPGSRRAYWACQVAGWGGYGALQAYLAAMAFDQPWVRVFAEAAVLYGCAFVLSHLLHGYIRRARWDALRTRRLVPRVLLVALLPALPLGVALTPLALSEVHTPVEPPAVHLQVGVIVPTTTPLEETAVHVTNWYALFVLWQVLYFLVLGARRRRLAELRQSELTRTLQGAELRLLKAQLNPHFLFNSLNSVRALIADDPPRAQDAVTRLARALRYTLGSAQDEFVTLEEELAMVDDYLSLEGLRLGERLTVARDVTPAARTARIPVMLLQGVVENAIKHGIAELPAGGEVRIAAELRDGALALQVDNPRPAAPAAVAGSGIGLRNAQERLRLLFGEAARLDLDLTRPQHARVRVVIPAAA